MGAWTQLAVLWAPVGSAPCRSAVPTWSPILFHPLMGAPPPISCPFSYSQRLVVAVPGWGSPCWLSREVQGFLTLANTRIDWGAEQTNKQTLTPVPRHQRL